MKKVIYLIILTCLFSAFANAQTREPSAPLRPFIVLKKQSLEDLEKSIRPENKVSDLIGGAGMQLRVAVQHDNLRENSDAEIHDASDDVYYVLEGSARLILGGKLENPTEKTQGEWKSKTIIGGQEFVIKKGDLIIVPRGTAHQRTTIKGKTFSMILIKVFQEPISAK